MSNVIVRSTATNNHKLRLQRLVAAVDFVVVVVVGDFVVAVVVVADAAATVVGLVHSWVMWAMSQSGINGMAGRHCLVSRSAVLVSTQWFVDVQSLYFICRTMTWYHTAIWAICGKSTYCRCNWYTRQCGWWCQSSLGECVKTLGAVARPFSQIESALLPKSISLNTQQRQTKSTCTYV